MAVNSTDDEGLRSVDRTGDPDRAQVTIVVTSFNPGDYLVKALDSVLAQTDPEWRLLLVDDASTDDSLAEVRGQLADPRIRLIRNEANLGQTRSLNLALGEVDTPYFLKLDADDWLREDTVACLLDRANRADADVGFFLTSVVEHDEQSGQQRTVRLGKWGRRYANRYQVLLANLFPYQVLFRTEALRRSGGWPTHPLALVEDLGIFVRLINRYRFEWVDEPLYYYRRHAANMTRDRQKAAAGVEWLIRDALRRWGGEYEPIFVDTPDGWRVLGGLLSPEIRPERTEGAH